jgi:hypothetical protein
MPVNFPALLARLEHFGRLLPELVAGISDEDARWKPESGNWSILEIVCHLADEEVEDFRQRTRMTLEEPGATWPAIQPEQAARERNYNTRNLADETRRFVEERRASIQWLRGLDQPDWDTAYNHPKVGPVTAGQLFVSWVTHDQLHIRQIGKRLYELCTRDGQPYPNDYAGPFN